jgi:hypothetical protein
MNKGLSWLDEEPDSLFERIRSKRFAQLPSSAFVSGSVSG